MCGSNTSINYPAQPSYGESLAESLKAQADFLKGTGDFKKIGSLESLLPLEKRVREKTAQADTDILRKTMLGTETGGGTQEVTYDDQGRIVTGQTNAGDYRLILNVGQPGGGVLDKSKNPLEGGRNQFLEYQLVSPDGEVVVSAMRQNGPYENDFNVTAQGLMDEIFQNAPDEAAKKIIGEFKDQQSRLKNPQSFHFSAHTQEFEGDGSIGVVPGEPIPIYAKDKEGKIIQEPEKVGVTETREIPVHRKGDGMVDLLGDTRDMTRHETRTATQEDVDAGLAEEVGDSFVQSTQTEDQAGFREGEFKGASVLAEDIQRGSLSRQREADLQDVSRLSGLYSDIMEDYKPGTQSAMSGAKELIEEQKDNLLSGGGISDPNQVASQGVQADPLRQGLMTQAQEALGQGLTDREERQIAEAARARSTMMGRTFDQSGAIAEAQARVGEDNRRKMQNRGFAQSVLGQEAGIQTADDTRSMGADQFNVGTKMDAERLRESLRQQGLLGYLDAASRISQIENQDALDPFQAILGRGGGTALQQGQSVFGQAGYGLNSAPQYLNPEAGLGYIQNQASNAASMYNAQQSASGNRSAGIFGGLGSLASGIAQGVGTAYACWVAREVYGVHNPAWLLFREWMLNDSPGWFRVTYIKFGERFAKFISNKPRLKARIRLWMDSKIGGK